MIRYVVQIDPADHVAANRLHLRPRRVMRVLLWLLGIPLFAVLTINLSLGVSQGRTHPFLPILLATGIFLALWYFFLSPRQIRRAYQPTYDGPAPTLSGELDDQGLTVTSEQVSGHLPWSEVVRWKRSAQLVLLYTSGDRFTMIPLRGFANAADRAAAVALLERHLGSASR